MAARQALERVPRLLGPGAERDRRVAGGDVARPELDPDWHAAQLPVDDSAADRDVGVRVELRAEPAPVSASIRRVASSSTPSPARAISTTTWTGATRGRQPQAFVVAVDHDGRDPAVASTRPKRAARRRCSSPSRRCR